MYDIYLKSFKGERPQPLKFGGFLFMEEWKYIIGYEGKYSISTYGRVRSEDRYSRNTMKSTRHVKERILKEKNNGYPYVILSNGDKRISAKIHRLVAMAFIQNTSKYNCINHIDGNKSNNHVNNLEWCTHKQNMAHAVKTGLFNKKGESHPNSKLNDNIILAIKSLKGQYSHRQISEMFGLDRRYVGYILSGQRWGHIQ